MTTVFRHLLKGSDCAWPRRRASPSMGSNPLATVRWAAVQVGHAAPGEHNPRSVQQCPVVSHLGSIYQVSCWGQDCDCVEEITWGLLAATKLKITTRVREAKHVRRATVPVWPKRTKLTSVSLTYKLLRHLRPSQGPERSPPDSPEYQDLIRPGGRKLCGGRVPPT